MCKKANALRYIFNPEYLSFSLLSLSLLVEMKLNKKKQKLMVSLCFPSWIHFLFLVLFSERIKSEGKAHFPPPFLDDLHQPRSLECQHIYVFTKFQSSNIFNILSIHWAASNFFQESQILKWKTRQRRVLDGVVSRAFGEADDPRGPHTQHGFAELNGCWTQCQILI